MRSVTVALRIWIFTSIVFCSGWLIYTVLIHSLSSWSALAAIAGSLIDSLPVLLILTVVLPFINKAAISTQQKTLNLILICAILCLAYGVFAGILTGFTLRADFLRTTAICTGLLLAASLIAIPISAKHLSLYFSHTHQFTLNNHKNMQTMINQPELPGSPQPTHSNRLLFKAIITGALILVMLIPTIFIDNLVHERQARQAEVANEVSDKWAQGQTLTGPYIYLPYKIITLDKDKKVSEVLSHLLVIPDNLLVNGQISHQLRLRSIYKVLLYKAAVSTMGNFKFQLPKEIDRSMIQWQYAKICYGLSDFKGIEERLIINFKGVGYDLSPGLPVNDLNEKGLSAFIPLTPDDEEKKLNSEFISG